MTADTEANWMDELKDAEQADVSYWEAEEVGDMVAGNVMSLGDGESDFGEYHFAILDKFDAKGKPTGEEIQLSFMGTVRAGWFKRNQGNIKRAIEQSQTVTIGCKYLGLAGEATGGKQKYKNYVLRLKVTGDTLPF